MNRLECFNLVLVLEALIAAPLADSHKATTTTFSAAEFSLSEAEYSRLVASSASSVEVEIKI